MGIYLLSMDLVSSMLQAKNILLESQYVNHNTNTFHCIWMIRMSETLLNVCGYLFIKRIEPEGVLGSYIYRF